MPSGVRPRRVVSALCVIATLYTGLSVPGLASAAPLSAAVDLSVAPASVASGAVVNLTATMPVRDDTGSVTQEIVQTIDPTKVKLTAASDIVAPAGWTVSYSSDGTNFSATPPASAPAWAAVRAVKATGTMSSLGSDGGRQVAQSTVSGGSVAQTPTTLPSSGAGLDGFKVFFDPGRTRVFNVYHHSLGAILDCYVVLSGARCAGFPFDYGGQSAEASIGVVVGSTAWIGGVGGLYCVDLAAVLANTSNAAGGGSPARCFSGGSSALVLLKASTWMHWFTGANPLGQASETQLYVLDSTSTAAMVYCIDTATRAPCSTPTINPTLTGTGNQRGNDGSNIFKWGDLLYVSVANGNVSPVTERVTCVRISTGATCPGWSSNDTYSTASGRKDGKFIPIPAVDGSIRAICYYRVDTTHKCWEADGTQRTASYYNFPNFNNTANSQGTYAYGVPTQIGSRVYYGNAFWGDPTPTFTKAEVICYDAAAFGGAGGRCNDAAGNLTSADTKNYVNYTVTPDPVIPNCLWVTQHFHPVFKTVNILTGQLGCSAIAPQRTVFSGATSVPRMGCSSTGAITAWRSFTLDTPATGFTSATLTVRNSSGADISGWSSLPLTAGTALDLSSLPVGTTGQTPSFVVDFSGLGGVATASARISAIGDSPQLCLSPTTIPECPATSVLVSEGSLFATTTSPVASGSTTPGGALVDDSATFTIQAPSAAQCGSTLTGRATTGAGGSGTAVSGATVTLLDDSGAVLLDDSGNAITATTDASGNYSFGYLSPGNYRVRFPSTSALSSVNAQTASGAAGSDLASKTAVAGTSTSGTTVLDIGAAGVVNGQYVVLPVAGPNTSVGGQGVAQSISPLVDDSASTGATYSGGSTALRLCGSSESSPNCTQTTLTVTGSSGVEGRYTVSGTTVSFQPCKATNDPAGIGCTGVFTGVASSVTYQSTDSLGRKASSTITPTVVPAPVAVDDTSTGAWSAAQSISPLVNDTSSSVGGTAYPLLPSTMGICAGSTTLASSCTGTSTVTTVDGSYSLNTSTGVVTFTPNASFTGLVTAPIKYAAADSAGQRVIASITPIVTAPPSPSASPETKSVAAGASVSFTTVTGPGGLGTSGGPALITTNTSTGTGLCPVGTVLPGQVANCTSTSVTVTGQGTYTLNRTTGVVTYAALAGSSSGSKTSVTYVIRDGLTSGGRTNWASAMLTPFIPGPPMALDDTASTAWDVPVSVNVLGNDSVDAGQSLVASSVRLCGPGDVSPACDDTQVTTAQGSYTVNMSTGAVSFDPLPTFWGVATPITYTVTDSQGLKDPATLTVTVAAPGLPVAADDTVLVSPGGSVGFDPLIGAGGLSSSGGPTLGSACLWVSGACDGDGVVAVNSGGGVYVLDDTTKVVTFHACTAAGVPHASCTQALSGQPAAVSYRVTDAVGQSDTGVLTARVPVAPVSRDDSSMAEAGATQVITPLGNDQAGDAALSVASLKLCGLSPNAQTPPNCDQTSITTSAGVYTVSGGSVTFVPTDDTPGTDVDVRYQVADVFGQTSSAVIRVTELPKPAPRPSPDALSGPYGQSLTFTPMSNDTFGTVPGDDSTNNVLTQVLGTGWLAGSLKLCGAGQAPPGCDQTSVTTVDGTYVISGMDVTFTGNPSFTGTATQPVMYQVANTYTVRTTDYGNGGAVIDTPGSRVGSSTITPTITVAPVAVVPDAASTPWNTPVSDSVLADDTSGAAINTGALKVCGPADAGVCAQTSVTVAGQGTYDVVGSQVRFTPLPDFSGAATPVTYRTTDALGRAISSTFTPTVGAPNGPTALPESKSVLAGGTVSFSTLAESGPLVAAGINAAGTNAVVDGLTCLFTPGTSACDGDGVVETADGTYVLNALTGVVSYTADPDAPSGPQVPVTYRVVDSLGLTATAVLTPSVFARPVVQAQVRTDVINIDQVFAVLADVTHDPATTVLASSVRLCGADDTAPDCTQMSRTLTGVGVFTIDPATGAITFNPDDTYVGAVPAVTYSVDDTLGQRTSATLTPTIVALPRPAAVNDSAAAASGSLVTFTPWFNDDTIDGPRGASVTTATLVPTSILLCGPNDVALPGGSGCDDTTVTTVDGTYVLDPATGTVVFTHAPGFTGTATAPVTYQIATDYAVNAGPTQTGYASALLTPTITASGSGGGGGGGAPPGGGGAPSPTPTPSPSPSPGPNPVTEPDAGVGRPGEPVRVDPIGNDTPGEGQVFDEGSLRLCPEGSTPPACAGLVAQTDQGTWVVDPFTGAVTFTPVPGFEGLVEMPYVVQTEAGEVVDSVISIWITDPPEAADDASSGRVDRPQTLDPWANDNHDAAPWDRGSLALCGAGQTPPNCDQTRVETPDGVYEVDPVTGKVIFTPAPGFTGTATPLQYQVADVAGQVASAWLRPSVRGGTGGADAGWLRVRKVITGNELRTGQVRIVTICARGDEQMRKVHRLGVDQARGVWRLQVPAGMRCTVKETAHGAPKAQGLAPMWEGRRWAANHAPTVAVGAQVDIGTAVPIDHLIFKAQGGCEIQAGVLRATAAGTCTVTWRAPDGEVATSTRWIHVGPRGTRVEAGTLTRGFVVRDGAETKVTFHNRYRTQDQVVTRTVFVTIECPTAAPKQATWTAPWASPQAMAAYAPRGGPIDPGTCLSQPK